MERLPHSPDATPEQGQEDRLDSHREANPGLAAQHIAELLDSALQSPERQDVTLMTQESGHDTSAESLVEAAEPDTPEEMQYELRHEVKDPQIAPSYPQTTSPAPTPPQTSSMTADYSIPIDDSNVSTAKPVNTQFAQLSNQQKVSVILGVSAGLILFVVLVFAIL